MKKAILAIALAAAALSASAMTFFYNGVLMGTVCRNGPYYTAYPVHMAQPVGTACPVRDINGFIIGTGVVTNE
jgi:hypothetical protein